MSPDAAENRQRQRAIWSAGDYPTMATTIDDVASTAVDAASVQSGEEVLDVATGTGNAALHAARAGARVTGIDLTPELLDVARGRAGEAGLEIAFEEGDAGDLPYADERFDRVISVFGAMFAPDQVATAAELARVVKPGGTIAVTAWTPEGVNGQLFATMGKHMPPPPEGFQPPILWGVEDHVRQLFADVGEVRFERRSADNAVRGESADAWVDHLERSLGPVVLAKRALEPDGRWDAARSDLVELFARFDDAGDGSLHAPAEYLLSVVTRSG